MKKIGGLTLGLILVWCFAGMATEEIYLHGNEVEFNYAGIRGFITIEAFSSNYSYQFIMEAFESFSGFFSGNSLSFLHNYTYEHGESALLVRAEDDTIASVTTNGENMEVSERFSTTGKESMLGVHIVIKAESEKIEVIKPLTPLVVSGYIRDDDGNIIGGYFENRGNATFRGKISFKVGLSYNQGWIAESVSQFLEGSSSLIVLEPKERIEFMIVPTPGAYTFVFPTILQNEMPISFSVFPPAPDSPAVINFKNMIYSWWTGYKDPEPDVDYIHTRVFLDGEALGFYFPIQPYFPPPR